MKFHKQYIEGTRAQKYTYLLLYKNHKVIDIIKTVLFYC